jgi:hypothetical protein
MRNVLPASLSLSLALSASAPLGCAAYGHEVEVRVDDPRQVWVESPKTGARAEPPRPGVRAGVAGTRDWVERGRDGAIDVDGAAVVGSGGWMKPPGSLEDTQRDGGVLRTPACVHTRRGRGCTRSVWLATPMTNVTSMMEHDVPLDWVGWLEVLGGVGLGALGAGLSAAEPYASGGAVLTSVGVISAIVGIVQLAQAPKNERVIVDPDE